MVYRWRRPRNTEVGSRLGCQEFVGDVGFESCSVSPKKVKMTEKSIDHRFLEVDRKSDRNR